MLASNAIDEAPEVAREMRRLFSSTLRIAVADYDNQIVVGGRCALSGRALRSAVVHSPILGSSAPQLSFRIDPAR